MNIIVFDVETTNFSKGNPFDPRNYLVSISARHITSHSNHLYYCHVYSDGVSNSNLKDIKHLFESNLDALIVGHFVKFDLHWLDRVGIKHSERYYCTSYFAYVALEGRHGQLSLGYLSGKKQDLGNILVHKYEVNPAEIVPSLLIRYNIQDVNATLHLFRRQQRRLKLIKQKIKQRLLPPNFYIGPIKLMNDLLPVIIECERNGFKLDREELERVRESSAEERRILVRTVRLVLRRVYGIKFFNLDSPKQLYNFIYSLDLNKEKKDVWQKFFKDFNPFQKNAEARCATMVASCFDRLDNGLALRPTLNGISKASLSVGRDNLKELIQKNQDNKQIFLLKFIYEISRLDTLISTFIDGTLERVFETEQGGWLHTSYNQTIARTGRLTSSNPNLHNWPREGTFPCRRCVVSRFKGGKIASSDASQLELRWGMWYYNDKQGRLDYENGIDIHGNIATQAYGAGFTPEQRTNTKSTVFRVWYRGTARGIVNDQRIPIWLLEEADSIVSAIYVRYTGVRDGQEADYQAVQAVGYLDTTSGRRYRFDLSSYHKKFQIANYPIQGGATGDFIPCAMIVAYRWFKERKLNSLLIGQVHDDILVDVYPGEEEIVEKILNFALTIGGIREYNNRFKANLDFPFEAGFKIKEHW